MPRRGEWKPQPLPSSVLHAVAAAGFEHVDGAGLFQHKLVPSMRLHVSASSRTKATLVTQFTSVPKHLPFTTQVTSWEVDALCDAIASWQGVIERQYHAGPPVMDRLEEILGPKDEGGKR